MTIYDGETFATPRKLQNGSAGLQEVYAWANSIFGTNSGSVLDTNYPLETVHADIFQNGGNRFVFALEPMAYGWEIRVYEKGRKEDLAELTPPLRGPNPTDIEGWNFRNEDNTAPNDGSVNVSQKDREFIFSPEVGKAINSSKSINGITEDDIDRIEAFGQGELKITRMKLSPPRQGGTAGIEQMNFHCILTWRQKDLEPMWTNTASAP